MLYEITEWQFGLTLTSLFTSTKLLATSSPVSSEMDKRSCLYHLEMKLDTRANSASYPQLDGK